MQNDNVASEIRELNALELDTVSGGAASAWEGAKAVAGVVEKVIGVGFGIPVSAAIWGAHFMQ